MKTSIRVYGDYPTIEEIKRDYFELMEIIKDVRTVEDAIKVEETKKLTLEINGMSIDEYKKINNIGPRAFIYTDENGVEEGIEWIRYESYGCLSYIYDRFDGKPSFDIWSNKCDYNFVQDITIDEITEEIYNIWMKEYEPKENSKEVTIEELWDATCSGNIDFLKNYYEKENGELNRKYERFGRKHSLIMGAFRNNHFSLVDYLINIGEKVTKEEREEMELELKKRDYMKKILSIN